MFDWTNALLFQDYRIQEIFMQFIMPSIGQVFNYWTADAKDGFERKRVISCFVRHLFSTIGLLMQKMDLNENV